MILVSAVTGIAAMGERNSLVTDCDADGADDFCPASVDVNGRRSTISALATTTDVLLFGGITVAAAGVVLALVLPDDAAEIVSASCGPGFCSATLSGSF